MLSDPVENDLSDDDMIEILDEVGEHQVAIRAHASRRTRHALSFVFEAAEEVLASGEDDGELAEAVEAFEAALRHEVGPRR